MFPFAAAIFLSAFLLFQVQPLISKVILPWFGGAANVWTTCMLFFQLVLLAGYAYAHLLKQFRLRTQALVHLVLLAFGAIFCFFIIPGDAQKPAGEGDPTIEILRLLLQTVGVPYFILSTTGPLLQSWFAAANPGKSPYRLYSLSNVGSLLALVSFPTFFETTFTRGQLGGLWTGGFLAFAAVAALLGGMLYRRDPEALPAANSELDGSAAGAGSDRPDEPSTFDVLMWLLLPAAASALLLSGTSQLMLDVAVVPFLYIMPLALYLLSFVICFDNESWYVRLLWGGLFLAMLYPTVATLEEGVGADIGTQILVYNGVIFFGCMACHGELAKLKPAPRHLTAFFLMVALGGAVGGFLCGIVAPLACKTYIEFPIALGVSVLLFAIAALRQVKVSDLAGGAGGGKFLAIGLGLAAGAFLLRKGAFAADNLWLLLLLAGALAALSGWAGRGGAQTLLAAILGVAALCYVGKAGYEKSGEEDARVKLRERNFFGALLVRQYAASDSLDAHLSLSHGRIEHGMQFADPGKRRFHTSYYGGKSGLGVAIARHPRTVALGKNRALRVGTIGLGTGTTATFCEKGDYFCFYDINPKVLEIADAEFTHLKDAPEAIPVFLGDARISLERQLAKGEKQGFDVLAVDAFSGDAIPTHLLNKECVELYLRHFRDPQEGILALHISNRYLRLERICRTLAKELGLAAVKISNGKEKDEGVSSSTWILLTNNKKFLADEAVRKAHSPWLAKGDRLLARVWTDDYCNLLGVIDEKSVKSEWPKLAGGVDRVAAVLTRRPPPPRTDAEKEAAAKTKLEWSKANAKKDYFEQEKEEVAKSQDDDED